MQDSKYYYNEMESYSNLINKTKTDKSKLEKLKGFLQDIGIYLPKIKLNLQDAQNDYLNGGYIDNNETFDKGRIKECCSNLGIVDDDISDTLTKINKKVIELDNMLEAYIKQYENASNKYSESLLKEKGE